MGKIQDAKELWKIALAIENVDAQKAVLELRQRELELQERILELEAENMKLRQASEQPTLKGGEPYYYTEEKGEKKLYCPACYDLTDKRVHLQRQISGAGWYCPNKKCDFAVRDQSETDDVSPYPRRGGQRNPNEGWSTRYPDG